VFFRLKAINTGTYCVSQTLNASEGPRTTVANLAATEKGLEWYDVAIAGTALAASIEFATSTYYVSQTN
jgi:hypothetical protein